VENGMRKKRRKTEAVKQKQSKKRRILPRKYRPNFLQKLDGRSTQAQILKAKYLSLCDSLGGVEALSPLQQDALASYLHVTGLIHEVEERIHQQKKINKREYEALLERQSRLFKTLGLQPVERAAPEAGDLLSGFAQSFNEVMAPLRTPPPASAPVQAKKPPRLPAPPAPVEAPEPAPPPRLLPRNVPTPPARDVTPPHPEDSRILDVSLPKGEEPTPTIFNNPRSPWYGR
jgi:hypothetical protein